MQYNLKRERIKYDVLTVMFVQQVEPFQTFFCIFFFQPSSKSL